MTGRAEVRARNFEDGPLSIVHAALALEPGGLERVALELAARQIEAGHRVGFLCVQEPGKLAEEARALGAEVHHLGKPPGLRPSWLFRGLRALRGLRPDVLHTHQIGALFYLGAAARLARVPAVIHTEHGKHYHQSDARRLARIAAPWANRFLAVSADIAEDAARRGVARAGRVGVVPNGIPVEPLERDAGPEALARLRERLRLPGDEGPVLGTLGRMAPVKRHGDLVEAFRRLRPRWPEARLLVVGDGPERSATEALAEKLGIGESAHFEGHQPRPGAHLRAMSVFALTSESEGHPLAVLEAWALRRPVVAPAVGGLPELIRHERDGLLYPPGDLDALVRHVDRLWSDAALRAALGQAGRDRVLAEFDAASMARRYLGHYRDALARKPLEAPPPPTNPERGAQAEAARTRPIRASHSHSHSHPGTKLQPDPRPEAR